jgi:hypothetical protein
LTKKFKISPENSGYFKNLKFPRKFNKTFDVWTFSVAICSIQIAFTKSLLLSQKEIKEFGTANYLKLDKILHKLVPSHYRAHILTVLCSLNSSNFVYNESTSPVSIENYYPNKNSSLFFPMSMNTLKYHDFPCLFTPIFINEALILTFQT